MQQVNINDMEPIAAYITKYGALMISALALWASWRANSHAKNALAQSAKVKLLEAQTEILREIDLQHAKLGSLLAVTAEAALAYAQNGNLCETDPDGHARIEQNLQVVQELRARYGEQRKLAEESFGKGNVDAQLEILGNIQRLTLHVQEDIENERRHLEHLQTPN
jgi:hypothetical protein